VKVRELLQIEIWSKKALRRILVGFGIFIVVLVIGFGVLYEVAYHWLTPGERRTGSAVLAQIDAIQNLETMSRDDFEAREIGLPERMRAANDAARTIRDMEVSATLFVYLLKTERERADVWEQNHLKAGDPSVTDSDRELRWKKIEGEKKQLRFYRAVLHKALD
jgi:hypothetical protein